VVFFSEENMDAKKFDEIVETQITVCRDVLMGKGAAYATTHDRLHNFRVAANLQGITMKQALAGMMAKHTISVYDLCNSGDPIPEVIWDEKITDHINYLIILMAIVQEES
jgi:hypothetical protein